MQDFIAVEEARRIVLDAARLMPAEPVPLAKALGRTLAEAVVSPDDVPPFDNSAMDGYALRAADVQDVPARLRVIDVIHAGTFPSTTVEPGTAVQIMTGAPIPAGADAVAPVEWTDRDGDAVLVRQAPLPGRHIRRAGLDVARGAPVFPAGTPVTPPVVGMLATLGYALVPVHTRPRVAVIATGDELAAPGEPLGPGRIRNSNGPALAAQAEAARADPLSPLLARDNPESLLASLEQALAADVIILSGGVSVGEHDYVKDVLAGFGVQMQFWKVRQRPGKPLAFGVLDGRPVFGLPGNPVSSAVCFHQYVRPLLHRMLGRPDAVPQLQPALMDVPISKAPGLYHFVRGRAYVDADAVLRVAPTGAQDSNLYSSVVRANVLIHLPEAAPDQPAGAIVQVEWLEW